MRIYCSVGELDSFTLRRVRLQLMETSPPGTTLVSDKSIADLNVILGIGTHGVREALDEGPCVILQLCYLTSGGDEKWWQETWKHPNCEMVGSYYDLDVREAPFVRFPLGFDREVFYPEIEKRNVFNAMVTGYVDGPEEISTVWEAYRSVAHVGQPMPMGLGYVPFTNLTDDKMRELYQTSRFSVGLRRVEGFELPIIEGAACGAIPVAFDMDCYRYWFDDFALFIDPDRDVVEQMRETMDIADDMPPIDQSLIMRFEMHTAWKPFWDLLEEIL